jgi:hypothetical protein
MNMNDENFEKLFFDVATNERKPGQIAVCYNNSVELLNCPFKDMIIETLQKGDAGRAVNFLTKIGRATSLGAYQLCKEMTADLLQGSVEAVQEKPYRYIIQLFFYTTLEHFPHDDPHWSFLSEIAPVDDI